MKFKTALELLHKLEADYTSFIEQLTILDVQLEKLKNSYINSLNSENKQQLGLNDIELKRIADLLNTPHHVSLTKIRLNFDHYAQLADSFTKDLQLFCSKCKDKRVKRVSADFYSDLTCIKSCTENSDNKYQLLKGKVAQLQDTFGQYCDMEKQFAARHGKFNEWLDDIEHRMNAETGKIRANSSNLSVKLLEEATQRFQSFKTTIQLERKTLYEIR